MLFIIRATPFWSDTILFLFTAGLFEIFQIVPILFPPELIKHVLSFSSTKCPNDSTTGQRTSLSGADFSLALQLSLCSSNRIVLGVLEVFPKGYRENGASEGKHLSSIQTKNPRHCTACSSIFQFFRLLTK